MIVVRDLQSTHQISNPAIRALVQQRIQGLSDQGFAIDEGGHFVVVDSTDTLASIEQHVGVPLSAYELIEAIPSCFDVVYVLDQSGKGIELFVPKEEGIDIALIAMCRMYVFKTPPDDAL